MTIEVNDLSGLSSAAVALLEFAGEETIFIFEGEMGAGKTTFIKALCAALGVKDIVNSPTFSIVNEYAGTHGPIYHFDFYRIKNEQEAFDIGYEDYFFSGHLCLVEWPQKIAGLLPENLVKVEISVLSAESRKFSFSKS